jgi:hypothetical protein
MFATRKRAFLRFSIVAMLAVVLLSVAGRAMATDISGNLTVDNAFFAYISTNPSVLGTLVASGNSWPTTFSFSDTLTPGVTNYLQIEAINYGAWGGLLGQFTLSDTGFMFANGSQTLLTDTTDWVGNFYNLNSSVTPQPWVQPSGSVVSFGPNSVGPWGTRPGIDSGALWIWPTDADTDPYYGACQYCTVDLMTSIYPTTTIPEPGTLLLFGSGIVALVGAVRRKLA